MRAAVPPSSLVILGHPVAQSLSPTMHAAALAAANLPIEYRRLDVPPDALTTALVELAATAGGGNVTMPHKEAVYAAAARRSALATRVGAVNTFWHEDGQLCGHNTDVVGVLAAIQALCPSGLVGRRVAVLGAGGSAAAVLLALESARSGEIALWSRTTARASDLAARVEVSVQLAASPQAAVSGATLVINATPLGMSSDDMPIAPDLLHDGSAVLDLVYRPNETAWVRAARARGLRAEDGLRMLVEQGAEALRVWFGVEPSLDAMWAALPRSRPQYGDAIT